MGQPRESTQKDKKMSGESDVEEIDDSSQSQESTFQ